MASLTFWTPKKLLWYSKIVYSLGIKTSSRNRLNHARHGRDFTWNRLTWAPTDQGTAPLGMLSLLDVQFNYFSHFESVLQGWSMFLKEIVFLTNYWKFQQSKTCPLREMFIWNHFLSCFVARGTANAHLISSFLRPPEVLWELLTI